MKKKLIFEKKLRTPILPPPMGVMGIRKILISDAYFLQLEVYFLVIYIGLYKNISLFF